MIAKIGRGGDFGGLMSYLVGPGRAEEHENAHLVGGDPSLVAWWGGGQELAHAQGLELARELDAPRRIHGMQVQGPVTEWNAEAGQHVEVGRSGKHVWHCSLALHPDEGPLTDEQWAQITGEFMARMGFDDPADPREPAPWVAVHHGLSTGGNDHVHIVANVVRNDGTKVNLYNDFKRASTACRELEKAHGLVIVEGREGAFSPGVGADTQQDRWEHERKNRAREARGAPRREEMDRDRLHRVVRACATAAVDEAEFVRRLRQNSLAVRPRFAEGTDEVVTGYAVALRDSSGRVDSRYAGGGRLAKDLSLTRLRAERGWPDIPEAAAVAAAEWRAGWRGTRPARPGRETRTPTGRDWRSWHQQMDELLVRVRTGGEAGGQDWALAAREASGALAALSVRSEPDGGPLANAARDLARSAWAQERTEDRTRKAEPAGVTAGVGAAAVVLLQEAGGVRRKHLDALLLAQIVRLAQSVHEIHQISGRTREAQRIATSVRGDLAQVRAALPRVRTIQEYDDPALATAVEPGWRPAAPAQNVTEPPDRRRGQNQKQHQPSREGTER